jgi:hypothetical protein
MDFGLTGLAVAGSLLSAGATALGAVASSNAAKSQADAERSKAAIESQWADRRAKEERAAAQRAGMSAARERNLAQSRLVALAGAGGGRTDDATVLDLWGDIEQEGQLNIGNALAGGAQRASGIQYQADLGRWTADANAEIKEASAMPTLIGGLMSAGGQGMSGVAMSRMGARYRSPSSGYRYG